MSVTTGSGDRGQTGLATGERLAKDDPLIELLGCLDELAAFLADALWSAATPEIRDGLAERRDELDALCALVAGATSAREGASPAAAAERLAAAIRGLETAVPLEGFVRLGGTPASAKIDICRTVCRRAERRAVTADRAVALPPGVLAELNRLSDYLFMAARFEEKAAAALRFR
jgi:cob(I)alamin adenosyltransferase